jgi:hypothetical protein
VSAKKRRQTGTSKPHISGTGSGTARIAQGHPSRIRIIPLTEVTGEFPGCDKCTWVAIGFKKWRIKYINRACRVHGKVECI